MTVAAALDLDRPQPVTGRVTVGAMLARCTIAGDDAAAHWLWTGEAAPDPFAVWQPAWDADAPTYRMLWPRRRLWADFTPGRIDRRTAIVAWCDQPGRCIRPTHQRRGVTPTVIAERLRRGATPEQVTAGLSADEWARLLSWRPEEYRKSPAAGLGSIVCGVCRRPTSQHRPAEYCYTPGDYADAQLKPRGRLRAGRTDTMPRQLTPIPTREERRR